MYWLLGRNSQLLLENKILLYKTILKPIMGLYMVWNPKAQPQTLTIDTARIWSNQRFLG